MCSDCNIHILDGRSLEPASGFLQCFDSPNTGCAIETEEVQEYTIYLLLHLKMEAKVDVLQTSQ